LTSEPDRGVLIKFIYENLLSTEAVEAGDLDTLVNKFKNKKDKYMML
jgi:hypothetical protein